MDLYKSLGELLKTYRNRYCLTQEKIAEYFAVELKTYQRWERDIHPPNREHLLSISRYTGIPMSALIPLGFGQQIFYSIDKRRCAFSKLESNLPVYQPLLTDNGKPEDEGVTIDFRPLTGSEYLQNIIEYDNSLYPASKSIRLEPLEIAVEILPDLNFIVLDQWGLHIGHLTCAPLSMEFYRRLRSGSCFEHDITPRDIVDLRSKKQGVFYFLSSYGATSFILHNILFKASQFMDDIGHSGRYLIANYAVSEDGHQLCAKLDMQKVLENHAEYKELNTDLVPTLFEIPLVDLLVGIRQNLAYFS